MSDIVERLRVLAQYVPDQRSAFNEAAAEIERLTAAVSGLFAGGFIEAGVRESDQWSQELDVRIGHLKSALPSTEKK